MGNPYLKSMTFRILLNSTVTPLGDDIEGRVISFLVRIGYLPENRTIENYKESVPYKLFMDCFVRRREKLWEVEALESYLGTSRATLYRHLNRLKSLGIIEETTLNSEDTGNIHKGYKLRFGNLSWAWNFTEAFMEGIIKQYRKEVDKIQEMIEMQQSAPEDT